MQDKNLRKERNTPDLNIGRFFHHRFWFERPHPLMEFDTEAKKHTLRSPPPYWLIMKRYFEGYDVHREN